VRLIFDGRTIAQKYTGLGRYTESMLRTLVETRSNTGYEIVVILYADRQAGIDQHQKDLEIMLRNRGCHVYTLTIPPISLEQHWCVSSWVNKKGADLYFYPHFDLPLGVHIPSIFVVHDLIPLLVDNYIQRLVYVKKMYFRMMIHSGVKRAEKCFAVSRTTKKDILNLVGNRYADKIDYAYEGPVKCGGYKSIGARKGMDNKIKYLLYVGDRRPHKNVKRIIDLFCELRDKHKYEGNLMLVGSPQNFGFDVERYTMNRTDIVILGYMSDEELMELYSGTDALLLLSEYEGFGLPAVEAGCHGRKVIISDGGALPEIAPPWAFVISRRSAIKDISENVAEYLRSIPAIEVDVYKKVYTWESACRRVFPEAYV